MENIAIISPSIPLGSSAEVEKAVAHLQEFNIAVQFFTEGEKIENFNQAQTSTADLIMASRGGFDSIELLPQIDFSAVRKPLCGYSDITVLLNALLAQTGKIQYLGPNLKALNTDVDNYTIQNFLRVTQGETPLTYSPSARYMDTHISKTETYPNSGLTVINHGSAEGYLVGGNLCSQIMLCGTKYYPVYENMIVVVEEDDLCDKYTANMFLRNLWALFQYDFATNIKGLIIGRFMHHSAVDMQWFSQKLRSFDKLKNIPIIANFDTGHTMPIMTLPLGQKVILDTSSDTTLYFPL